MTVNATAVHSPERESAGHTWSASGSLLLTASLAAVVEPRMKSATSPHPVTTAAGRMRVAIASARPAANPAGSHATAIRSSGCAPCLASSSSGSAPDIFGPTASTLTRRSRYSQPTPATTATTASSQPAALPATRSTG